MVYLWISVPCKSRRSRKKLDHVNVQSATASDSKQLGIRVCKKRNVVNSFLGSATFAELVSVHAWSASRSGVVITVVESWLAVAKDLVDCFVAQASERFNCRLSLWLSLQRARGAEAVSSKCVCFPKTQRHSLGSVPNSPFERVIPRK